MSGQADAGESHPQMAIRGGQMTRDSGGGLLENSQSVQRARGFMDRERPVPHDPLCLRPRRLRGDGRLEDALVRVKAVEIGYLEGHEEPEGGQCAKGSGPPRRGVGQKKTSHVLVLERRIRVADAYLGSYNLFRPAVLRHLPGRLSAGLAGSAAARIFRGDDSWPADPGLHLEPQGRNTPIILIGRHQSPGLQADPLHRLKYASTIRCVS